MFAPILNWVMGADRRRTGALAPVPATDPLEAVGWKILSARRRRLEILEETRDLLIGLPMQARPSLVDRLAARFALYVWDLPASERDHDAGPFGLLDHSLEVARRAVGELVRPSFRPSEDPAVNYREQPVWAYSGFVLGLLHDLGKVLDLDVLAPGGESPWNPASEPLGLFLKRLGRAGSGRECWRWKIGRGLNGHVPKGEALVPAVLPSAARNLLGQRLGILLRAFTRSYEEGVEDWGRGPAGRVVQVVRHWDRMLAKGETIATSTPPAPMFAMAATPSPIVDPAPMEEPESMEGTLDQDPAPKSADPTSAPEAPPERTPAPVVATSVKAPRAADNKPTSPQQQLSEDEGRIRTELAPARLIETIRTWVRAGNVSRNNSQADMFVSPEYLWLKYPQAFMDILEGAGLHWSGKLGARLLQALLKHPQVEPLGPPDEDALVSATPTSRTEDTLHFIRIKSAGFLPDRELATLGLWSPGLTVVRSGTSEHSAPANRSIGMRRAS